ncbi:MAG: methyltransferase family protein, partial [Actinophytocola sp.]|uniref:methyltransferase family protein n=1 Tax=Actinophytocola sp. TaxID=1872138 RepID=UPI003D6B1ADA
MTAEATLGRIREYMVGPTRFMNLLSCFELGIVDAVRDNPGATTTDIGATVGVKPDAVEQLLFLLVKEGFVAHHETTDGYTLDALAYVPDKDLNAALDLMYFIKATTLRQLFYLSESARTGTLVGLKKLYDFDGTLYEAAAEHQDIGRPWSKVMDATTERIDPWFFSNIDVPAGARVLDLAGNTGLGAIHTYKYKQSPN